MSASLPSRLPFAAARPRLSMTGRGKGVHGCGVRGHTSEAPVVRAARWWGGGGRGRRSRTCRSRSCQRNDGRGKGSARGFSPWPILMALVTFHPGPLCVAGSPSVPSEPAGTSSPPDQGAYYGAAQTYEELGDLAQPRLVNVIDLKVWRVERVSVPGERLRSRRNQSCQGMGKRGSGM